DPCPDEGVEFIWIGEVWWRLNMGPRSHHQASDGDPGEVFFCFKIPVSHHGSSGFRPEILHNGFLNMAPFAVRVAYGNDRLGAVPKRFTDAQKNPGGEGDARASSIVEHLES